ncbi:MAG: hypothetical protein V4603_05795 [Pseudomonadota bacterium]
MLNLFRVEFLRYRTIALAVAVVHFMALYYLSTLTDSGAMLVTPRPNMWIPVQIILCSLFGLFQMLMHKRGNDWIYLLHRPLSLRQIFAALALAGSALCAVMSLLPALLILIMLDSNSLAGIEAQHYLVLLYAAAIMFTSYFCGCFATLGSSKLSFLAVTVATSYIYLRINERVLLAPLLLSLGTLWLAADAFKPDLTQAPQQLWKLALHELPIQYGLLWFLMTTLVMVSAAHHSLSGSGPFVNPQAGTDFKLMQLPAAELLQHALQGSTDPDAGFLSQQVTLGEAVLIAMPAAPQYALRYQSSAAKNKMRMTAEDGTHWIFSHTNMLYEGRDPNTGDFKGWLGPEGIHADAEPPAARFASPAMASNNQLLTDDHNLYSIDWQQQRVYQRYHSEGEDTFLDVPQLHENMTTVMTTERLLIFSSSDVRQPEGALMPRAVLQLPTQSKGLNRQVVALELIDGYLVAVLDELSQMNIGTDFDRFGHTRLQLYRTRNGVVGQQTTVDAPIPTAVDDFSIYNSFVAAPGMRLLTDLYWGWYLDKNLARTLPVPFFRFPTAVLLLAAVVSVLSAAVTAWLLRTSTLPVRSKRFWIVANAFTGLCGVLSFMFGHHLGKAKAPKLPVTGAVP